MQSAGPTSGSSGDVGENYSKYESPFDAGNGSTHFLMIPIESTMKTVRTLCLCCACACDACVSVYIVCLRWRCCLRRRDPPFNGGFLG